MSKVGYIRVSSVDQNLDRQLSGLKFDKVFEDKCSGKDTNRQGLMAMLEYIRECVSKSWGLPVFMVGLRGILNVLGFGTCV